MLALLLLPLVTFLRPCSASSLFISIPASLHLPNPNSLSSLTHGTLLSGSPTVPPLTAHLTTRSTVEFHNLTIPPSALGPQTYLLTISALSQVFAPYRVDLIPGGSSGNGSNAVIEGVWETYPGFAWSERGPILGGKAAQDGGASGSLVSGSPTEHGPEQEQAVRIEAKVLAGRDFYEERPGFNPLGMLMNPMVLFGVMAMGLTFGMPYLMDNLDPEMRAELDERTKNSPLASKATPGGGEGASNFDLASWMAGVQKGQQGVTSGADVREGGVRRKRGGNDT